VTPLGDSRSFSYDARIVVASQRPLSELVTAGRLRADLAMRFGGLTVAIPSLAQRRADIPTLFAHFLRENASGCVPSVSSKFYERLCVYEWPGNIRELELLARRMLALHGQSSLSVNELPETLAAPSPSYGQELSFETRDEEDLHRLQTALKQTGGNLKKAAALVSLSRARAYRLLGKQPSAEEGAE
jgi:DNA-binding NtrC family response regulator